MKNWKLYILPFSMDQKSIFFNLVKSILNNCPLPAVWRKTIKVIIFISAIVLTAFLIPAAIIPAMRAELKFHDEVDRENYQTFSGVSDSVMTILETLESRNSFLKARNITSRTDSIVLVINLPDSIVSLQLQGVTLYEAKLHNYTKSKLFRNYSSSQIALWTGYPFQTTNSLSSIPKLPIIYRKAPKDTAEAAEQQKSHVIPDGKEDTWFRLYTNRSFIIFIEQSENPAGPGKISRRRYLSKARKTERREVFDTLANFRVPEYQSWIKIVIPRADARVLYRALPEHALVVIRL